MRIFLLTAIFIAELTAQLAIALEVDREVLPRITLGGRIISTLDLVDLDSDPDREEKINLGDSNLLLRFDKQIYSQQGVAGAVIGLTEHDDEVRFQQLHAFYWNQDFKASLGRGRLPNHLIELPTLRDDDFLTYSHVGNASSTEEFDQIYGESFKFDWFVDRKMQAVSLWAGTRNGDEENGFNSYGLGYQYAQPEHLHFTRRIRLAGIQLDRQKVEFSNDDEWITAVIAGADINLNRDPSKVWSLAVQAIVKDGIDGITQIDNFATQAQAESSSLVAALRYINRPNLLTSWQAGLTFGYKDYSDMTDATQFSIAPSFVYKLGQGIDLLTQVIYTSYDDGLYAGGDDVMFQVGISFSLESVFNDQIHDRNSILNLEHKYIQ